MGLVAIERPLVAISHRTKTTLHSARHYLDHYPLLTKRTFQASRS